ELSLSFSYDGQLGDKSVCVVEIGHKTTAINIYRDDQLLMPRQVPVGGEMVTRAIADNLGMSFADAEQIKINSGELPRDAAAQAGPGVAATIQTYNPFATDVDVSAEAEAPVEDTAVAVGTGMSDEANRIYNAMAGAMDEFVS